ncbi:MAG: hypothetical protein RI953_1132 [Pseudomonadota bacterium]|jgi:hypothetical protein
MHWYDRIGNIGSRLISAAVIAMAVLCLCLSQTSSIAMAQTAAEQTFNLPEIERIRMRDEVQKHVTDLAEKSLVVAELKDKRKPVVNIELNVDRNKLNQDFLKHQRQQREKEQQQTRQQWSESTSQFLNFLKAANSLQRPETPLQPKTESNPELAQPGARFGILNTGNIAPVAEKKVEQPIVQKQAISPSINFSSPMSSFQPTPFSYSLYDYLVDVSMTLHVPTEFKEESRTELRKAIIKLLGTAALNDTNANDKIKFNNLAEVKANETEQKQEQTSWVKDLLNPKNQSLSGLFMSLAALLGFVLVGVAVFFTGRSVAQAIGNVAKAAQAATAKNDGESQGSGAASAGTGADAAGTLQQELKASVSTKSRFSLDKEADLLAQTRVQISESVAQWCAKDPVTVGEVLVDIASGADGMHSLNSLLLYSGYDNLKPALELLPNKLIRKLDESLNASWKEGAEMLPGLEAAQLMLAGMIPRQTALLRFSYDTKPIRKAMLKLDVTGLKELCSEISTEEASIVFRLLPQGVALELSNQLGEDRLKEIMAGLGQLDSNKAPAPAFIEKIDSRKESLGEQKNIDKERLLRAMVKGGAQMAESKVLDFLGADDLGLRFDLLQEKFFTRDLELLEPNVVRGVIDKLPLARKANFLFFADPVMRQKILDLYPKETKALEALLEELENINNSQRRKTTATNDKAEVFALVCGRLLDIVKADLGLRINMIEKIANSMGAALPDELAKLASGFKENVA